MMLVHYSVRALRTTMIDPNSNDSDIHGRADTLNVLLTTLREQFNSQICHQMINFKKTWDSIAALNQMMDLLPYSGVIVTVKGGSSPAPPDSDDGDGNGNGIINALATRLQNFSMNTRED